MKNKVPCKLIPHSKPTLGKEEELEVIKVMRSAQISQGEQVAAFERVMADYIGRKYAVAVSSGISALEKNRTSVVSMFGT